ncbi:hypothetical protein D3C71_1532630 [compost metagenome]
MGPQSASDRIGYSMLVECLDYAGKGKADVRAKAGIIDLVSSKSGGRQKDDEQVSNNSQPATAGTGQDILMGFADHMTKTHGLIHDRLQLRREFLCLCHS